MKSLIALSLLLSTGAAANVRVDTAETDWSFLPMLKSNGYDHLNSSMMQRIYELASSGDCALPGESWKRIDLRLSFAAQFTKDGKLIRVVLPRLNCPEGEGVLGGTLIEMINGGDYKPTGENPEGWYRGNLSFAYSS